MRQLDTDELLDKFQDYTSDIYYSDYKHMNIKIDQLFNFLNQQDISKRILERIEIEFAHISAQFEAEKENLYHRHSREIMNLLLTREDQGAFAYFALKDKFLKKPKYSEHYLNLSQEWYETRSDYYEWKSVFDTYFTEPFREIVEWYLRESATENENDYFSYEKQDELSQQLNRMEEMLIKNGFGQEIIFDEIHDVKKLTKKLNQKNWKEVIKGKFADLVLEKLISIEIANKVVESLTGEKIKFL